MDESSANPEAVREIRARMARLLADQQRVHLALAQECRVLKRFTIEGHAQVEIDVAAEMMEQYLAATDAFLENFRGRFEARLGLLRRGEPQAGPHAEQSPKHGAFWLAFSRLCAVLRRAERRVGS